MKKILFNITLLLLVSYSGVSFSQIRKLKPIDEFLIKEDIDLILLPKSGTCGVYTECPNINNFTFTSASSFNNAVANHNATVRAAKISHRNWFNNQKEIIKNHLENKFGEKFSNYDTAKNKMFFHSETNNLTRVSVPVRAKYSKLRSDGFSLQKNHKKELKLLKIREAEIKAGNIENSVYGYIKVGDTYLKDIKNLTVLKNLWNPLVNDFSKNTATTHINNYIYFEVGIHNSDLVAGVVNLKNKYYNRFNDWDKLDFVQFLINFEQIKTLSQNGVLLAAADANMLMNKFSGAYQANEKMIEDNAIKNRKGGYSIFDDWWIGFYAQQMAVPDYDYGRYVVNKLRTERLNELLEAESTAEFTVSNLIRELGGISANQKDWLLNNIDEADKLIKFVGEHRHMGKFSPQESHLVFSFLNITEDIPNANFLKYKELYNSIEGFGISDENQIKWLYTNETEAKNLIKFADDNRVGGVISDGAKDFIKLAIESIKDTSNFIDSFEKFKVYYCDCSCEGSETEYTDDLTKNMEPKWGQLANKQEILNEINSISNLNSLTFEEQVLALENYFNKNLSYIRNSRGELIISNSNNDVNKYIYTEVAGWLDFHHVFKLFKWAREKGPLSALFAGEM